MCDDSRRKAEVAEDDVLHARIQEGLAARPGLGRLLAHEVEDDGEVVRTEAPERVLVLADLAEVLAVPVHVEQAAELLGVDEVLELGDAGVVEEEVARHEDERALLRQRDELLAERRGECERLLDEDVLAGEEGLARELEVRDDRGRDRDRVHLVVGEDVVEARRLARVGEAAAIALEPALVSVADPRKLGAVELVEVPREVRAPVPQAYRGQFQSFHTRPFADPFLPVALRKSTTSLAFSASAA